MFKNARIRTKILLTTLIVAFSISFTVYLVLYIVSSAKSEEVTQHIMENSRENLTALVKTIYQSCATADQVLTTLLEVRLKQYKKIISNRGNIGLSSEKVSWEAVNQFNKAVSTVQLPKMTIGGSWLGQVKLIKEYQAIVDDLNEKNFNFTIFQKMNDAGDMLRVATNVVNDDGNRALGTFIPATNPDGSSNHVIRTVISGNKYYGTAFVVNDYYLTIYEPIKDGQGQIIGMLFTGVSLSAADKLRKSIVATKIGETGYMYVLGGSGARKGYYIISKDGKRDGENIWDVKDADGNLIIQKIIEQATNQPESSVSLINYKWLNPGDDQPNDKIVALAYYKPFDWVIGAGTNLSEIDEISIILNTGFTHIYIYIASVLFFILILVYLFVSWMSKRIADPISYATNVLNDIAKGDIKSAMTKLENK